MIGQEAVRYLMSEPRSAVQPASPVSPTVTERLILGIVRQVNHREVLKRASNAFLRTVGAAWVHYCTRNLLHVTNADVLDRLPPDVSVVVASNHRSFFDMYVLSSVLLRRLPWIRRMYFPVRSEYWYDRWDGLIVNALMSGLAMFPPVYRDSARRALNRDTVSFLVRELQRAGTVIGLHPEGQRSSTDDPYTLLPAQPGLGEIVHRARPLVVPAFILGLSSDLIRQVRGNFDGTGVPITITFGEPVSLGAHFDAPAGPRTSLRIAQAIRDDITALGALDRRMREQRLASSS